MSKKERTRKGISKWKFRGVHTLRSKRNRTLFVMVFDDRVIYYYVKTVPIYIEEDGAVCRSRDEPIIIHDYRARRDHE